MNNREANCGSSNFIELNVGTPGHGGFMLAKPHNAPVIFVRGALPGERVIVQITERSKSYWRGEVSCVVESHPERIPHSCPTAAIGAGCCDYSFTSPEFSRDMKKSILLELLRHIAKIDDWDINVVPLFPSDSGWRVRARLTIDQQGNPGLFKYRSSIIIPRYDCQQYDQRLINTVKEVYPVLEQQWMLEDSWDPLLGYTKSIANWRLSDRGIRARNIKNLYEKNRNILQKLYLLIDDTGYCHAALGRDNYVHPLSERPHAQFNIKGMQFVLPVTGFWQPHVHAAYSYSSLIRMWIEKYDIPVDTMWDFYSGAGLFAKTIREFSPHSAIVAIDSSSSVRYIGQEVVSICDKVENLLVNHSNSQKKLLALIEKNTASFSTARSYLLPNLIVVDPPRLGVGKKIAHSITSFGARSIIHFGCDIAAFSRDIAAYLASEEYILQDMMVFDAFPGTDHLECVALLLHR